MELARGLFAEKCPRSAQRCQKVLIWSEMNTITTSSDIFDYAWTLCYKNETLLKVLKLNQRQAPQEILKDHAMIQQIYLTGFLNAILKVFMTYLVL